MVDGVDIKASFHRKLRRVRDESPKAVAVAVEQRLPGVRADTPVLTGRMKAAWRVIRTRSGARLKNYVPYSRRVDRRRRIVRKNFRKALVVFRAKVAIKRSLRRGK